MYAGQWRRHPVAIKVVAQSAPLDGSLLAEFHREVPPPPGAPPPPPPRLTRLRGQRHSSACLSEASSFRGRLLQRLMEAP